MSHQETRQIDPFEQAFENITRDLYPYLVKKLRSMPIENLKLTVQFVTEIEQEKGIQQKARKNLLETCALVSAFRPKPFKEYTRDDILAYLNKGRKSEADDPKHQWIGTYNIRLAFLQRFFKWLYHPEMDSKDRPLPEILNKINKIPRKEQSIYEPTDLWTTEDIAIFLKYCPNRKYKAIVALSNDLSARPAEILDIKIKDILWLQENGVAYAKVKVKGKTGERVLPIFASVPYLKDWLNDHPLTSDPDQYLFPSAIKGNAKLRANSLNHQLQLIYKKGYEHKGKHYAGYFYRLLEKNIPQEDKIKLNALLRKPWNPYVHRHTSLTAKSRILKEGLLKQHAGWTKNSPMINRYIHYFNQESSDALLRAYGVLPEEKETEEVKFTQKICPNCNEPNRQEANFCINPKCRFVLNMQALEELKKQEQEEKLRQEEFIRKIVEDQMKEKHGKK